MEMLERNKTEILNLESIWKEKFTQSFPQQIWASRIVTKLKETSVTIIQSKEHKEKRVKLNQQMVRRLRDATKRTSMSTTEVPELEARENGNGRLATEMTVKGPLGGAVSWVSDSWFQLRSWSQGHGTEPGKGLCAKCGACLGFLLSSPLPPLSLPHTHMLSPSQIKQKKFFKEQTVENFPNW